MATFTQLPSGAWRARIDVRTATGERRRISRTAPTKRELRRLVADIELNGAPTSATTTVADLIERWLDGPARGRMRGSSHAETRRTARTMVEPVLGEVRLDRLTVELVDDAWGELLRRGYAPATVRRAHGILRSALGQGVRWGLLRHNVAADASPPSIGRTDIDPPSPLEVRELLELAGGMADRRPWWPALLRLAASTGARKGELIAARLEDFVGTEWRISRVLERVDTGYRISVDAKTSGSIRTIALDRTTLAELECWRDFLGRRTGWAWPGTTDALPMSPQAVNRAWWATLEHADLGRRVRFHDLRHAHATTLLSEGFDVRTVAGRLGHANPATLLRIYAAWMPARDEAAAGRIGELLAD